MDESDLVGLVPTDRVRPSLNLCCGCFQKRGHVQRAHGISASILAVEVLMTRPVPAILALPLILLLALGSAGCAIAGGIFKAGFWVGIVLAVIIVVGLMMLFRRA
jgi:hypothetical protein